MILKSSEAGLLRGRDQNFRINESYLLFFTLERFCFIY